MVKCDKCPMWVKNKDYEINCRIDDQFICWDGETMRVDFCPLSRIELKDGTVYEPEVIDE